MEWHAELADLIQYSTAPRYNIQAVERAAGISARTLRSWERRYGVPVPGRDASGRRMYSDRDIAVVRLLMRMVQQGVAISRASTIIAGQEQRADTRNAPRSLEELQLQLLQAIDWMDEREIGRILTAAGALAGSEDGVLTLIKSALFRVGELWEAGQMSVASEHVGSNVVRAYLADRLYTEARPSRSEHLLVGCAPTELHDIGALIAALALSQAGFRVTYLGASVEATTLASDLRRLRPAALCLSASTPDAARELAALYTDLQPSFGGVLAYGGRAFELEPGQQVKVPGLYLGADVHVAPARLDAALDYAPGR